MRFHVTLPASDEAGVVAVVAQLVSDPEAFVEAFFAVLPTFFPGIQHEIGNGTLTGVGAVLQSATTTTLSQELLAAEPNTTPAPRHAVLHDLAIRVCTLRRRADKRGLALQATARICKLDRRHARGLGPRSNV
ncbi:unnamed protein product [Symbiodinium sp. CCMP2592]|nr:unnamed protein product [Symbiodinium sp. CCMP2592]